MWCCLLTLCAWTVPAGAAANVGADRDRPTLANWQTRAVYQLLTDRFAGSAVEEDCTAGALYSYCGGTWCGCGRRVPEAA